MSIKIHHGPDGTFKTSGAIKDDILKIVKTGRTLVTNVRGFSKEKTIQVLGEDKVHPDFKVIHIDTDVQEGRDKFARFFHWAPKGCFFVIDEVQRVFPPKWTERDLRALDFPEPQDHLPEEERRPETIHVAFDMQRHHNWDFVFTTTNIKKVHDIARVMAKSAVRHVNLGIWRFYKTVEHDAESNGKTSSSVTSTNTFNYVPKQVFELYASTTTGAHTNNEPRKPFYKDPKVGGLLFILVAFWGYVFTRPAPLEDIKNRHSEETVQEDISSNNVDSKTHTASGSRVRAANQVTDSHTGDDVEFDPAKKYIDQFDDLYFNGYTIANGSITVVLSGFKNGSEYQFSSDLLKNLGGNFVYFSECLIQLRTKSFTQFVLCAPRRTLEPVKDKSGLVVSVE